MKYNVVKDYDWCSSPRGSGMRGRAPRVWVKSYKLESNQIMQTIKGYMNILQESGGDAKTFYENMYGKATSPEDDFNFPFFGDDVRSFSNEFGDTFQNGVGGSGGGLDGVNQGLKKLVGSAGQLLNTHIGQSVVGLARGDIQGAADAIEHGFSGGNVEGVLGGNPGTYVETPMFYQFSKDDGPVRVSFILSNTINSDFDKNYELIKKLTEINRPLRNDSISVDPPRIFRLRIPGHRYIPWAYCNSFSIKFLGTRRQIGKIIIPEGYNVEMSFRSLTLEHAGFMNYV